MNLISKHLRWKLDKSVPYPAYYASWENFFAKIEAWGHTSWTFHLGCTVDDPGKHRDGYNFNVDLRGQATSLKNAKRRVGICVDRLRIIAGDDPKGGYKPW